MPRHLSRFVLLFIGACCALVVSRPLSAQEGLLSDEVVVTPDVASTPSRPPNTSGYSAVFTVENPSSSSDTYELYCSESGPVTCGNIQVNGNNVEMVSVGAHQSKQVTVFYSVGSTGVGTLTLTASGSTSDDGAWTVPVAGAPTVTIQVPGSGATTTVHNRQPIIRAFFAPTNDVIDTAATRLVWRGDTITGIARHNRRLIEWEVDSTRWLRTGLSGFSGPDTAQLVVKACGQVGGCTTATQTVILPNDSLPILGFTGMPLGTLNGGFSAGFGPGLTVVGAEIETGFSTPAFFSMGAARSTGLVYSTRQSYPRAIVNVDLDLPHPTTSASSIKLVLIDGITRLDSLVLSSPSTACLTGSVRRCRATLQGEFTTGGTTVAISRKWLKVEATVVSDVSRMTVDSVEAVIVDRRGSSYGSGWWPSAMSKLVAAGSDRVLVGPTGTAIVYRGSGDSIYIPPPGNFTELRKVGGVWELRARGSQAVTTFDTHGRLVRVADPSGNRDSLIYSGTTDRVTSIRDPLNKTLTFAYDGSSRLTTITDPGGRVTTVTIDAGTNQLRKRQLPADAARPDTVGYAYQAYPGTNTAVLLRRHGVLGDTTQVVYDSTFRRRPVSVRLPRVAIASDPDTIPIVEYYAYERQGYTGLRSLDSVYVELKDPRGNWTRSLLNRWAQSRRSWDTLGLLGRSEYDADGFLQWSEGKNGDSSRVYSAYDAARRLVKTYINRGSTTGSHVLRMDSLVYDASHRVTSRIDARSQATQYTYDAQGRITKVRTPNGASWDSVRTWYASNGLVDSTKHSGYLGNATRQTYDATWKNPERVISNTGDTLSYTQYDTYGRATLGLRRDRVKLIGTTVWYQWTRSDTYLAPDNLVDSSVTLLSELTTLLNDYDFDYTDSLASTRVGYRYDAAGRDTARVNARGTATTYRYDRLGRVVARRPWADSTAVRDSMIYDIAGNLHQTITRRDTTITHYYDSRNRDTLTVVPGVGDFKRTYGGPQDQLTRLWIVNSVDPIGGVNGEVRYGYDTRGRLTADTAYTGSTPRVATYTYDTYERPSTTTDAIGQWSVRYETVRGLADTLITPLGDTVLVTINSRGQATDRVIRSTGSKMEDSFYFKVNATANQTVSTPTGPNGNYTAGEFARATEDEGWRALSPTWTQKLGSAGATEVLQDSTGYDAWGRLTRWNGMKDGVSMQADSFTFDRTGNISQPTGAATYDPATDRLLRRVNGPGNDSLFYDRAGNLTRFRERGGPIWNYGYDALNRMVSVRRGDPGADTLIARYAYDVLGRRVVKRVYSIASGGSAGYTRFVYRGNHVGYEADSAGTIGLKYTWGAGTDQLLAITDGATHYYASTDRLGSIRSVARRDGTWVMTQRFTPYGVRMSRDTSTSYGLGGRLRYAWTGREWDAETGLSYHRARYYLPTIRRWTQEDPIGYSGSRNLYAYVEGSVLETRDPSGLIQSNVIRGFIPICSGAGNCITSNGAVNFADDDRMANAAADYLEGQGGGGGGGGAPQLSNDAEVAARARVGDRVAQSPPTTQTRYGHLSRSSVTVGDKVEQGQLIGYSGSTGAREPHLHFEVREITSGNGVARDASRAVEPLGYLEANGGADPLDAMTVTSPFSGSRTVNGVTRPHLGVDLRARSPLPVYAAFSGTVVVSGPVTGYGIAIYINH